MTRKAMSIIGRIIGLLLVIALAFGITWCTTHWSKVEAEWNKIFNKAPQQEQPNEPDQPTPDKPSEEQINLDGLYYINVDGDYSFVQIKDSKYGIIGGYIQDSKIYLFSDWESSVELNPFQTTEDDKYLHVFVTDQANGQEYKIAIYDKTSKTLYYDFSNGQQIPGETYEEQLLSVMTPFTGFVIVECQHETIMDMTKTFPTCTEAGLKENWCYDCNKFLGTETLPALGHDYVDGVCSRCGETDPNHVEEVSSLDGYYVNKNLLEGGYSRFSIVQIKGNKYAGFVVYLKNNDPSTIYFPQDYLEYIEAESALSLVYEETDEIISIGISEYMEAYKDNEEYFNVYKNYLVFDKQTNKMTSTRLNGSVEMIKIDTFEILPYVEPRLNIEDNTLYLTDMTATDGTYTVYYLNSSTGEEGAYVAGNVAEFDLTVLFNHYPNLVSGDEYTIRVVFATNDGFLIQGYESIQYTAPNGETAITYQLNYDLGSLMEFVQTDPNGQYTTTEIAINFTSNGKSYSMIKIEYGTGGEPTPYLLFDSDIIYYVPSSNNIVWTDEAYRTITFETAPTGDLLAWLQANATLQA